MEKSPTNIDSSKSFVQRIEDRVREILDLDDRNKKGDDYSENKDVVDLDVHNILIATNNISDIEKRNAKILELAIQVCDGNLEDAEKLVNKVKKERVKKVLKSKGYNDLQHQYEEIGKRNRAITQAIIENEKAGM